MKDGILGVEGTLQTQYRDRGSGVHSRPLLRGGNRSRSVPGPQLMVAPLLLSELEQVPGTENVVTKQA